jgi:hypothetical protein
VSKLKLNAAQLQKPRRLRRRLKRTEMQQWPQPGRNNLLLLLLLLLLHIASLLAAGSVNS